MLLMGKSTFSTGPCSSSQTVCLPGRVDSERLPNYQQSLWIFPVSPAGLGISAKAAWLVKDVSEHAP